jgi:hypothetical protein
MVQSPHGTKGAVMCRCPNAGPPKCRTYFILPSPDAPLKERTNVPAPTPEKQNAVADDTRDAAQVSASHAAHREIVDAATADAAAAAEPDIVGRLFGKQRRAGG